MERVGIFEAKTKLSALCEKVAAGETYLITKRGEPVAKLIPCEPAANGEGEGKVKNSVMEAVRLAIAKRGPIPEEDDFELPERNNRKNFGESIFDND